MPDPVHDPRLAAGLAADRRAYGHPISPGQGEQAAALPADLWAARQGITPDHWGYSAHLPRAAIDTISALPRRPPASCQRRPQPWQHRQKVDR